MNRQEFLKLAKENGAGGGGYNYSSEYSICQQEGWENDVLFSSSWKTGGVTGNSCWGTKNEPVSPETPPDFIQGLDNFLEAVKPDMSFMQYRKLLASSQKSGSYSDRSDYYGNYYDYSYKAVSCNELFTKMAELFPQEFDNTVETPVVPLKKRKY